MAVPHEGGLNELVTPQAIPYSLNVSGHMLPLEKVALDMWRKPLHGTEVVEAIPDIVDMASCKVIEKHLPECGQMEKPPSRSAQMYDII